jgi:glutaredoxin-like YruB-family protein
MTETKHKVVVYGTNQCPWCNIAKQFLKKSNITFEEVDVSQDAHAAQEMVQKSGQMGVPVIEIDTHIIVGFNERKIKELLELKD